MKERELYTRRRAELALQLEPLLSPGQGARSDLRLPQASAEVHHIDTRSEIAKVAGLSHDTIAKAKVIAADADGDTKDQSRPSRL